MLMNELRHGGLLLHGWTFVLGNDLEEIGSVAKSPVNQGRGICVWPNSFCRWNSKSSCMKTASTTGNFTRSYLVCRTELTLELGTGYVVQKSHIDCSSDTVPSKVCQIATTRRMNKAVDETWNEKLPCPIDDVDSSRNDTANSKNVIIADNDSLCTLEPTSVENSCILDGEFVGQGLGLLTQFLEVKSLAALAICSVKYAREEARSDATKARAVLLITAKQAETDKKQG